MFKKIILSLCILGLNGCTVFAPQIDKAAQGAGKLVTFYCANTEPAVRELLRAKVNAAATPNSVAVTCVGSE